VINLINKNLLLLNSKTLILERVSFLLRLSKASNILEERPTVTFILSSCISVIIKLSSLNCSNRVVNPLRFNEFIVHLVVVVKRGDACFSTGRVLVQDGF
jgi:hypothetical protein